MHTNRKYGELIIVGKNKIDIELEHCHFREVLIAFDDTFRRHHHPCNPKHKDHCHYEIIQSGRAVHRCILRIHWDVSIVRRIVWEVIY